MVSRLPVPQPNDAAREGTCAAWVAEMVLTGQVADTAGLLGKTHENGWLIEADMVHHVARYVDLVKSHGGQISVERKVRLNQWVEGTPDAYAVLTSEGILIGDDLKYGFGIVEPHRNPQVSIYLGAILNHLIAHDVVIRKIIVGIYQPRAWHPAGTYRTWVCTPEELMKFVGEIEATISATQVDVPRCIPGSHCEYQPCAATCAAVSHENYRVHEHLASDTQRHMSTAELAEELAFLELAEDLLKAKSTAVKAEAEARIKRAEHIPGWHLEERRGNRRFKFEATQIKVITGVNPMVSEMVTPAQLERMGASPTSVAALSEMPLIAPKLKRVPKGYYTAMFAKGRT